MALEGLIFCNFLLSSLGQRVFIVMEQTGDVDDKDFVILFNDDVQAKSESRTLYGTVCGDLSKSRCV